MEHYKQQLTEAYNQYSDAIFRYCYFKISPKPNKEDFMRHAVPSMESHVALNPGT